jgi:hypothetical protein
MLSPNEAATKQDLEKKEIEIFVAQCTKMLGMMREVPPEQAERIRERLNDVLDDCPHLPPEFVRRTKAAAKSYECASAMRATDIALQEAMHKAKEDDKVERNRLIDEARLLARKAGALGAGAEFQHAVRRKIENIMMSGGIEHKGPTAAKPASIGGAHPHHARG